jgi:hypothetical protein
VREAQNCSFDDERNGMSADYKLGARRWALGSRNPRAEIRVPSLTRTAATVTVALFGKGPATFSSSSFASSLCATPRSCRRCRRRPDVVGTAVPS